MKSHKEILDKELCENDLMKLNSSMKSNIIDAMNLAAEQAFGAGREFDSIDGVVDIDIVLPMEFKTDMTPRHCTFKDYLIGINNE